MSYIKVTGQLGSAVAAAGTFTLTLPARPGPEYGSYNAGDISPGALHSLNISGTAYSWPKDFSWTVSGQTVTVTNKTSGTWASGLNWIATFDFPGRPIYRTNIEYTSGTRDVRRASKATLAWLSLGAPAAGASNNIATSQSVGVGASFSLNGTLVVGGVVDNDTPRAVQAAWTGTSTITITGKDEYGNTMTETSASGTSHTGKKAFARITGITSSASITLATVGTNNVLGLPTFLPGTGFVLRELQDDAAPTAGTIVAGVTTAGGSTATTGDVRGTYTPNATPDGAKRFALICALLEPEFLGMAQA